MSTTTPSAIRSAVVAIVAGLTPATSIGDRFKEHREEQDFRAWCGANPAGCLRRFSVRWVSAVRVPTVTNTTEEWVSRDLEIVVAYPTSWRAGGTQLAGLIDAIDKDVKVIANAVGTNGAANYVTQLGPATVTSVTTSEDSHDMGPFHVGVVTLDVGYYRSNT